MCGIVGIADQTGRSVDRNLLERMCARLIHRGPDDDGFYTSAPAEDGSGVKASAGLGMRRLSIIDLATGKQPIHNEDRTVWVVLNGEIYNHRELRADLEARGHSFYTNTDTESIVHAYEQYGTDVPRYLRGMFAFALWDEAKGRLLLARDRVGKKPLVYSIVNGKLIFASEFQALFQHPDVAREVRLEAISHYLSNLCVPAPMTAFRGVEKLEPAHTLLWQDGRAEIERYWSLDFTKKLEIGEREAAERAVALLKDAVGARLMSDVGLGAFLSGGIDSSAVVALMSELSAERVKTFSIGFEEQDFSEVAHARRVAERFGTDHHEFIVRPDAVEVLPRLVRHYGEPYADSSAIPTYYLSKMTRQHVKVALSGDGSDECFAGYERYAAMRIGDKFDKLPRLLKDRVLKPAIGAIPEARATRSAYGRIHRLLDAMSHPRAARYQQLTSAINSAMKAELCTKEFTARAAADPLRRVEQWFTGNGEIDIVDRVLMADTFNYLPNDLLVKVDIASMAVSLEARAPFLDHNVLEFAASLPARYKLRGLTTKYLLKKALKGLLPEENLARRKMGFGVPVSHWFRGKLRGFLAETLLSERTARRGYFNPAMVRHLFDEHTAARRDYGPQLWTLMMLELWHEQMID